ncbi:MAG: HAD-IC family P-type ATPase, partial [Rhizobacter sp.]|nr:HAD-IC family P-type ATPase [Bacteriovorax sp.]
GYRPHPLKLNQETSEYKIQENRSMLLRIGVAGAASGNIMLYAVSLYAGANAEYAIVFNALTVLFAIPVLTYSAYPFYRNSYMAIKNKTLSIDVPISLALIMGAVMGIYNLIRGINENYFDSLTALVFLLLISRYFLKLIQEKGLSTTDMHFFYQGENILKMSEYPDSFTVIHPKSIRLNDILKISPNQIIPADAEIISGQSYLNNSLLTGESQLQKVYAGDKVYSGTMNVSSEIIIKVLGINKNTRLGSILKSVEDGWGQKSKIVDLTNRVSKYFVLVVFALAFILFFAGLNEGNTKHAFEQALTLLIVTCPCALAIATPLTFIRTLSKSAQKGIVIKDDAVIEKLSTAKNIFIDKTGTLTENKMRVTELVHKLPSILPVSTIIYNLEKSSRHPVAKSLMDFCSDDSVEKLSVSDLKEIPGVGISGIIAGHYYEIKNYSIYEDSKLIAHFSVKDSLREDSYGAINKLRFMDLNFKVISGDKKEYVEDIAQSLDLMKYEYAFELSPEEKAEIIKASQKTVMIGDGANDSIALSYADTGIAVHGAMDISLRAADVYLNLPGMNPVVDLIIISKETMKVVYRNLILSLCYNSVSVYLAFTGRISPLTAAIIMPLSSLTVLISTIAGTKELRKQWK